MSATIKNKLSKNKGALERIEDLEKIIPNIASSVNQGFTEMDQQLSGLTELVQAILTKVGPEEVQAIVRESRLAQRRAEVAQATEQIAKAVADGKLLVVDTIQDGDLVVGVETDVDGNVLGVGRVQLPTDKIRPELLEKLLGQPVGTRLDTPGGVFEVQEIYRNPPVAT